MRITTAKIKLFVSRELRSIAGTAREKERSSFSPKTQVVRSTTAKKSFALFRQMDFRSGFDLFCAAVLNGIHAVDSDVLEQLINASLYKNWGKSELKPNAAVDTLDYSDGDCLGGNPFTFFKIALDADAPYAAMVKLWLDLSRVNPILPITPPLIAAKYRRDLKLVSGFTQRITDGFNEGIFDAVVDFAGSHKCAVIESEDGRRRMLLMSMEDNSTGNLLELCASPRYTQMHIVPLLRKGRQTTRVCVRVKDFTDEDSTARAHDISDVLDRWIVGKIPDYQKIIDQPDALIARTSLRIIPSRCLSPSPNDVQITFGLPTLLAVFDDNLRPEYMMWLK